MPAINLTLAPLLLLLLTPQLGKTALMAHEEPPADAAAATTTPPPTNSTEGLPGATQQTVLVEDVTGGRQLEGLKRVLLRSNYRECCPIWSNLSTNPEVIEHLESNSSLSGQDLLREIKKVYFNITYLSIDGQSGSSEREQYYNYYDAVQYYLRLLRVAHEYLDGNLDTDSHPPATLGEIDFKRLFRRHLRSMEFKANRDPTLSSFITELLRAIHSTTSVNNNTTDFDLYEDFIRKTKFGQSFHNPNVTNIVSVMRVSSPSYLRRLFN